VIQQSCIVSWLTCHGLGRPQGLVHQELLGHSCVAQRTLGQRTLGQAPGHVGSALGGLVAQSCSALATSRPSSAVPAVPAPAATVSAACRADHSKQAAHSVRSSEVLTVGTWSIACASNECNTAGHKPGGAAAGCATPVPAAHMQWPGQLQQGMAVFSRQRPGSTQAGRQGGSMPCPAGPATHPAQQAQPHTLPSRPSHTPCPAGPACAPPCHPSSRTLLWLCAVHAAVLGRGLWQLLGQVSIDPLIASHSPLIAPHSPLIGTTQSSHRHHTVLS
jgi:hypothetical protein